MTIAPSVTGVTMQAAVLHGKQDVRVETVLLPLPDAGEIIVRVEAALTCGTDLKVYRRGYHARMLVPPALFGHELAGVVSAVGEGVTMFCVGDRVVPLNSAPCGVCYFCKRSQQNLCDDLLFNNGAYAEYIRVPARIVEKNTLRVPGEMPFAHAALTEPLACCMRGIQESGITAQDNVAVIGAGPIGLLFIHAVSLLGAQVIAIVKRDEQVLLAKHFGAIEVVQTSQVDDVVDAVRALTPDGRGADVVLEAVALPETWQQAVLMARKGGTVNFFGGPPAGTTVAIDTNLLHYGDLTLKASFHHTPAAVRSAFALLAGGKFKAADFITGTVPLEQLPQTLDRLMHRTNEIKVLIDPCGAASKAEAA